MTLTKHELKQGSTAFLIWTLCIGCLLAICIFLFPEMKDQMSEVNEMFASMGSFTDAFGMDRLSFGTLIGFYTIECGNILGLGGAFYASLCAAGILCKEEQHHTAEFLLTHPIKRSYVLTSKLLAVSLQITTMNLLIFILSIGSIHLIGETIPWKELGLLHLAFFLLQLELAGICFGISSFLRRGRMGLGLGLGLATLFYFLNIIANITESAEFLKYLTPFAYCDGADIIAEGSLNFTYVCIGMFLGILGIITAYLNYSKKDIHS